MNPDCTQGKHRACSGDAWDLDTDQPTLCSCDCHIALSAANESLRELRQTERFVSDGLSKCLVFDFANVAKQALRDVFDFGGRVPRVIVHYVYRIASTSPWLPSIHSHAPTLQTRGAQ